MSEDFEVKNWPRQLPAALQGWVTLVRDVVVTVGVLLLVGIGWNLHQVQVSALEAKAELLELTQFDRAHNLIEAQKALHQIERQQLLDSIAVLGSSGDSVQVASMRGMLSNIDSSYAWWNGLSSYLRPGAVMPLDTALLLSNAWIVGHANLGTPPDSIG